MYNLTVDTAHTFFVGEGQWLVHNTSCISASWSGLNNYRHGGDMTAMEHIIFRHGPDSGFTNVSRFSDGTSARSIKSYVDEALEFGTVTPNGKNGYEIVYDLGSNRPIGLDIDGNTTSQIKVYVRDGQIKTAFPY